MDSSHSGFRGSQSASTLSTVDELGNGGPNHSRNLVLALEDLAMSGLANNLTFIPTNKPHATSTIINWISELVSRIIE